MESPAVHSVLLKVGVFQWVVNCWPYDGYNGIIGLILICLIWFPFLKWMRCLHEKQAPPISHGTFHRKVPCLANIAPFSICRSDKDVSTWPRCGGDQYSWLQLTMDIVSRVVGKVVFFMRNCSRLVGKVIFFGGIPHGNPMYFDQLPM